MKWIERGKTEILSATNFSGKHLVITSIRRREIPKLIGNQGLIILGLII